MTVPSDPKELERLRKVAEANLAAGDWVADEQPVEELLKRIGDTKLSSKK